MFPTRDIIWKKQTDVCLFRFWARGQQFKINHTEIVPFTNFGAKCINSLWLLCTFRCVFCFVFPLYLHFFCLETAGQNQKFFAILIILIFQWYFKTLGHNLFNLISFKFGGRVFFYLFIYTFRIFLFLYIFHYFILHLNSLNAFHYYYLNFSTFPPIIYVYRVKFYI